MGFQIEDGRGTGQTVGVSATGNRLSVSSRADERIYYVSRDNGDAYSFISIDVPGADGEHNFYIKNTSTTQKLYIKEVTISHQTLGTFKINKMSGTATGTSFSGTNLNFLSGNTAAAQLVGNGSVAGATSTSTIWAGQVNKDVSKVIDFHDSLILGQGDAIGIQTVIRGAAVTANFNVVGFYDIE
jgi:hypothetical protein